MAPRRSSLTPKRIAFAREYAKDCNATQAAIRAGFSPRSAKTTACRLLSDPQVTHQVQQRMRRLSVQADVTTDRVLRELARIAFADIAAMVRVQQGRVTVLDTDALSPDQRGALAEIGETSEGLRVKLHDKARALEMLGKYLAMWTDRTELTGSPDAPLVVVQEAARP